jgi:hypothetical protein
MTKPALPASARELLAKCHRTIQWVRKEGLDAQNLAAAVAFAGDLVSSAEELHAVLSTALGRQVSKVLRPPDVVSGPGDTTTVPGSGTSLRTRLALFTKTRAAVLSLYLLNPTLRFHIREAVRRLRMGQGTVQKEIAALWKAGLLVRSREGKSLQYQANPNNSAFAPLRALLAGASSPGSHTPSSKKPDGPESDAGRPPHGKDSLRT